MIPVKQIAFLEGLVSVLFWGFGYVASVWALESFSVSQILSLRFLIVGLLIAPFLLIKYKLAEVKRLLRLSLLPGLFLVGEIYFQLAGLTRTTPTKAAFITVLFVVIVPVLEAFTSKNKIGKLHWIFVIISLIGTGFLTTFNMGTLNLGDVFILFSSFFVSLHILSVSKISQIEEDLFAINLAQCFWAALFTLSFLFLNPLSQKQDISIQSGLGLLSLTFGTTLLAFYFQMRSQRELSPSTASILFLLESPVAAFFSFFLLGEILSQAQLFGCFLIFFAVTCATLLKTHKAI